MQQAMPQYRNRLIKLSVVLSVAQDAYLTRVWETRVPSAIVWRVEKHVPNRTQSVRLSSPHPDLHHPVTNAPYPCGIVQ
jgi:hypothetical protein